MLKTFAGYFFILTGVVFLLKPAILKKRLEKKTVKQAKKLLLAVLFFLSFLLISAGLKMQGVPAKIVIVLGVIGIFKAFFIFKAKAAEKIVGWFLGLPQAYFRAFALFQVLLGVGILLSRQ